MKKFLLALLLALAPAQAFAVALPIANVVTTCGTLSPAYLAGRDAPLTVDTTGTLCLNGGGGGGTPGGSSGQVQYNNAGAFGGITGATTNGVALTLVAPVLGTPASGTLTNTTGLPISTGVSGLGTGIATFLGTPSSANFAAAITDETGSGLAVFATSPTLTTPTLGAALATTINGVTIPSATDTTALLGTAQTFTAKNTFAAGTITTSQPFTITQTLNAGGVAFTTFLINDTNTASASGTLLVDLQVGSVSQFKVDKGGNTTFPNNGALNTNNISIARDSTLSWSSSATPGSGTADTILQRDGTANTIALRNGVNPQTSNIYGTITDASNKDYLSLTKAAGGDANISTQALGTGTGGSIVFAVPVTAGAGVASTNVWKIGSGAAAGALLAVTDNTYDIGASGATRPRNVFVAGNGTFGGQLNVAAMTQSSAAQSGTVCYNSGTGAVNYDATLGCLTSSLRFKHDWRPLSGALSEVMHLEAGRFLYNDPRAAGGGEQIGLNAENMLTVEPDLVGYAPDGQLLGVRYQNTVALLVAAVQEQQREIETIKMR